MMTRATPLLEPGLDRGDVADAAAELERNGRRFEDALDRGDIDRPAGKGAVEIDDMEILEALRLERLRLRRRIAVKDGRARHVALLEPHADAVLEIDGGKEDHDSVLLCATRPAVSPRAHHGFHFRKLPISLRPSRWLFSGWNWVPTMVSRPTTAVTGPP